MIDTFLILIAQIFDTLNIYGYTGCGLTISTFWYGRIDRVETRTMANVEYF